MNVGGIDRVLRIVVGGAILIYGMGVAQSWWGLIGAVPLITGIIGWCPPYSLLGLSTSKK